MSRFVTSSIRAEGRLVLPAAALAVALLSLPAWTVTSHAASGAAPLLLHGNYCGPGNNAPLAPIDALDAACARHDACTPDGGLASRACNLRLQRDAELISRDPRQPEDLRALAGLVSAGAALLPSDTRPAATPAPLHAGLGTPAAVQRPDRALVPDSDDVDDPDDADAE